MATGQKTEFTVNAKDKTKKGLLSAQKNLNKTSKEADKLAGRFRNVARATVIMEGPLGGTAGRLSAMATMFNSVGASAIAFGVGVTGLTAIAIKSLSAFADYESQMFKVNQLLKQTGNASGLTAKEIEEMSLRIGRATLASTGDVREATAVLLSFKSVGVDAFERTMDVAADLSAVTGNDLKQSLIQLGKALEDPMSGMSALRRSGVSFTNSQKEMIVQMNKMGDVAGAQAEILSLLEGQLGGAGAAEGQGLAGAIDLVSENWTQMLTQMASSGAGKEATSLLNVLAGNLQAVGDWFNPGDAQKLADVQARLVQQHQLIADMSNEQIDRNKLLHKARVGYEIQLKKEEKALLISMGLDKEAIQIAREKGRVEQENIKKQKAEELARLAAVKAAKEAADKLEADTKTASSYGQRLIDDEQKLQTSLLNKGHQEDIWLEERLSKIDDNLARELISKESAHEQEQAAYSIHNAKLTEINAAEMDKQNKDAAKLKMLQVNATKSALSDISTLMASGSKRMFALGKASAVANSLINTYQAVTKTMTSVPYPFNVPLAVAQGLAGMVQVNKIKNQKMAAREFGGPTVGGRTYLVGERGPELFTSPRSGQIINNSTTSALGGQSNVFNITNILESDKEFISRNMVKIWEGISEIMNEQGKSYA